MKRYLEIAAYFALICGVLWAGFTYEAWRCEQLFPQLSTAQCFLLKGGR